MTAPATTAPTLTRRWLVDDTERPHCARFRLSDDGTCIVGEMWDDLRECWIGGRPFAAWRPTVKRVAIWAELVLRPDVEVLA